jgi:hypothetical protein
VTTTSQRSLLARAEELYRRTRRPASPRTQRLLLVLATVLFVGGTWFAFDRLDIARADLRWPLLIAAAALAPLTVVTNTGEYLVSARMLGTRPRFGAAFRLTVLATAANLLPLPGAFLVRIQGLRTEGATTGLAATATAIVGLVWLAVSALLAGVLLLVGGTTGLGGALTLGGLVLMAAATAWSRRLEGHRGALLAATVAVELAAVTVNAVRLVLVLLGLGIDAGLAAAFVLAISSSLASATGMLPGGFGIREAIAAALAPLVGLTPAAGFAATAVNRLLGIAALAPISLVLALRTRRAAP